jgi:light-regulated signal transduction histidine kinase (bacteriophytochrome)
VEDNPLDSELVQRELRRAGFDFTAVVVQTRADFIREVQDHCPQIVLADYNLPQWRGMEALAVLEHENVDVPLILVTGALGEVTAVECLKKGATDYVLKGALARLPVAVHRALRERTLRLQRKMAEHELAQKVEELARSNKELEQFAYVASHDLQEPLRMVASYTQLLGERYQGKLDDTADKYIGYAVEGAKRMQTLIQDLLAFSRAGRNRPAPSDVDCNLVMKDVLQNLASSIDESGAVIACDDLPVVAADRMQLTQLLQNLIGNAIKFRKDNTPLISVKVERPKVESAKIEPVKTEPAKNGSAKTEATRVEATKLEATKPDTTKLEVVNTLPANGFWQFSVSDEGIGISPEHLGSIFSVFHRLHTRAEYPGNGIGLAISKKIVEQYGGTIWVESSPGQGSTFKFTLPAAVSQAKGASA